MLQATGESTDEIKLIGVGEVYVRNTHRQNSRLYSYDVPYQKSAAPAGLRLTRNANAPLPVGNGQLASQRYALNRHLANAKENAIRMKELAARGDVIELSIHGSIILSELQELWRLRHVRETEWSEILNFLQAALQKEPFERYTSPVCDSILRIITEFLGGGACDRDEVRAAKTLLQRSGLDPWKAISHAGEVPE